MSRSVFKRVFPSPGLHVLEVEGLRGARNGVVSGFGGPSDSLRDWCASPGSPASRHTLTGPLATSPKPP